VHWLSGQLLFYVARERQHFWSSLPGRWLVLSSITDVSLIGILALNGFLMTAVPFGILAVSLVSASGSSMMPPLGGRAGWLIA
jgi:H+-transporting ATPase